MDLVCACVCERERKKSKRGGREGKPWAGEMQICPDGDLNTSILWVGRHMERHRAKGLHGHPVGETLHPGDGRH